MLHPKSRRLRASGPLLLNAVAIPVLSQPAAASTDAPCYDPDGSYAAGYYPCDATAYITNCCAAGWTCFSSALCVVTEASTAYPNLTLGAVGRAMCTNPLWTDDICGDFCLDSDDADGDMVACGDDNRFCCRGDYDAGACSCAANGTGGSFVVNSGRAQTVIGEPEATSFTGTPSYLTSLPIQASTSSPSTSLLSTDVSSPSSFATGTLTNVPTATANGSGSGNSTSSSSSQHSLTVGLGVGLGVGIPAVAVGFGLFWCCRRRHASTDWSSPTATLPSDLALDGTAF